MDLRKIGESRVEQYEMLLGELVVYRIESTAVPSMTIPRVLVRDLVVSWVSASR